MGLSDPVIQVCGIFLLYLLVVGVLWWLNDVKYAKLADSNANVVQGIIVSIGAGLVLLVIATSVLGWWGDVLTQPRTGPPWAIAIPVAFGALSLFSLLAGGLRGVGGSRLAVLAVGTLIIGAAEELLSRGLLVVGAQHEGWSLSWVWLFSTGLFALLHAMNSFFGLPVPAMLSQLVMSFLGGTVFFVTLMVTGSLLVPLLLHAFWDFTALGRLASGRDTPKYFPLGIAAIYLTSFVAVWFVVL